MKAFLSLVILLICQSAWAEKFMIPVLPDTQCEVNTAPTMFKSQMDWIANNKGSANIKFVIGVGDIIDWDTPDHHMWITASDGYKILDHAGIPYALAVGNHDTAAVQVGGSAAPGDVHANVRITTQFNKFFPISRFVAQQGRYQSGKSDNAWYTFTAGGMDWLVLTLELWARQGPVDWAKTIVASHPNHNVIVVTHSHLHADGTIVPDNGGYGDLSPQSIFDQFIGHYPNILLVLSGHVDSSAWRNDAGVKGNRIYQILQDYQNENKGAGYIRLLEIDTTARTISSRMYSSYLNRTKNDSSMFSFENINFIGRANAK